MFKTDNLLMQVIRIAECSKGSILQYFLPVLSYHLSLRPCFVYFWGTTKYSKTCLKQLLNNRQNKGLNGKW